MVDENAVDREWDTDRDAWQDLDTVVLDRYKLIALEYLGPELARYFATAPKVEATRVAGFQWNQIVLRLIQEVYGLERQIECIEYPANWWEAVKDRWMPGWLKYRFPVRYIRTTIRARELYPQIDGHHKLKYRMLLFRNDDPAWNDGRESWCVPE